MHLIQDVGKYRIVKVTDDPTKLSIVHATAGSSSASSVAEFL